MRPTALALASALLAGAASAQTFPSPPKDGAVYDRARLLAPADVQSIVDVSRDFKRDTGAPIVVATFPSLKSVGAKAMGIERYSTALFNKWRIGHQDEGRNGGILLVVAKADRKVRIELGKDWRHDYDAGAKEINQGTILPAFRKGDFAGGIVRGTQALAGLANSASPMDESVTTSEVPYELVPSSQESSSGGFPGGLFCIGVPVLFFIVIASSLSNRRRGYHQGYGSSFGQDHHVTYVDDRSDDAAFLAGVAAGQSMSQPSYDPGPSYDSTSSFDSSSSDSGSSFDSGSSGGGGDTGSW